MMILIGIGIGFIVGCFFTLITTYFGYLIDQSEKERK